MTIIKSKRLFKTEAAALRFFITSYNWKSSEILKRDYRVKSTFLTERTSPTLNSIK